MLVLLLALSSFVAWFVSSLAGGGSPFIIIPMVDFLLETQVVPPVVTTGMLLGNFQRVLLFWQDLDWQLTWWYLPGAVSGAILGAFVFTQTQLQWLQVLLGLFLVSSIFSFGFGRKERSFRVSGWFFLPAGFAYAFLSGLIGSIGPVLNPFYLNYGLVKEKMIATKSAHVLVVHVFKLATYAVLGALTIPELGYGLVIGLAAAPGNWLGQLALRRISEEQFRQFVVALVTISGLLILWEQRDFFAFW
ncbi:MAG: sulfite exporter TauE/SafE family protein [Chroococcidiopsidaceae cyanobacterium CP_BM_ER_R8_30]|nr:sulfite exporter TauE/SafE family protein [Chroococcidiopsidaceae cyanobacterium CP_BM_ER_R8_30]